MDQAATVADGRRTEPLHVTVGGRSLALQVIVHYDFVVPDPTVELGQQEVGGQRGYDAGKKINGRKRHIVVDTLGLILALVVHPADVQNYDGAVLVLEILGKLKQRLHRLKVSFAEAAAFLSWEA
jgi:Transposase DDE domain